MVIAVRALVATVLSGLVVWGATGCGTETVGGEELAQAADASQRTAGVKVAIDGEVTGPQGDLPLSGEGVMDMKGQRGEFTFRIQGQEIHQVMDRLTMYMRSPQFDSALDEGKEWAKIDLERSSRELGVDVTAVQQPGSGDPRQMFAQLKTVSGDIEKVGTDEVRGVDTTHYRAKVKLDDLHKSLPPERREAARKSVERMKELAGLEDYPIEVWIDDDDLVRKMRLEMDMKVLDQEIGFDFSMEFYDYGTRVAVELPPEDEVQDLTDLAAQGASGLGGGGGSTP